MAAKTRTVLVTNRSVGSTLSLVIGTLPPPFQVLGAGHYTLEPYTSMPVTIAFTPAAVGIAQQNLLITSGDPKHPYVSITVSAMVQPGRLSAPKKIAFIARPASSVSKTVTLRNSGKGMLSGVVQPFGPTSPLVLVGGPVSFTLAPGEKQPITIKFAPVTAGSVSGSLAIVTNPPPATTTILVTG